VRAMKATAALALCGLLILAAPCMAGAANAAEVDLTKGRLFQSGTYSIQTMGALNKSGRTIDFLEVECGFFLKGQLIRPGGGAAQNVQPGQTAYFDVRSSDTSNADSTECRVGGATPKDNVEAPRQSSAPPSWDQTLATRAVTMALLTAVAIDLSRASGKPPKGLFGRDGDGIRRGH
jgi:hypothetical protein